MVLPVIMVLMLGMTSGATAWNQSQALGHGGQVAGRFAATAPLPATTDLMDEWLDVVLERAISASEGKMTAGTPARAICVAYVDPAGAAADKTYSRRINEAGVKTDATTECFADSLGTTAKRVQVVMQRSSFLELGFYRQPLSLSREIVYRYEADSGL
jgi:Flp pilus assembly protein TadG